MALSLTVAYGCDSTPAGYLYLQNVAGGSGTYDVRLVRLSDGQQLDGARVSAAQLAQDALSFEGLYDGQYRLLAVDAADASNTGQEDRTLYCANPNPTTPTTANDPLAFDFVRPTDAQAGGGGSVAYQARGGVAPLTVLLAQTSPGNYYVGGGQAVAGQPGTFSNLAAGEYLLRLNDSANGSGLVEYPFTIKPFVPAPRRGCTDPAANNYDPAAAQDDGTCTYDPPVRLAHFEVPPVQSLRFVRPGATDRPAFDNTLLADEHPLDYENPGYCQLVEQGDTLVLQAQSNYQAAPVLELRRCLDNLLLATANGQRVQQGAGETAAFEVYLKADTTAGRTRVYFNDEALPLPFRPAQRVTISATGTALDGTYPVRDALEDAAAAVPYLLLPVAYPAGTVRVDGSLSTAYVVQTYDTYQFVLPFSGVPAGCYYARVRATDAAFGDVEALSEPIDVGSHPDSILVAYRNFDNAYGLNYSAGLVNRLRVMGRFFERQTATEKTVLRNDDGRLVLLAAAAYRKVQLETLLLPDWLHETLAVAFCHDAIRVQGVPVIAEGEYATTPVERYPLSRGTVLLERTDAASLNRDDLGDVDAPGAGPYLLVNSSRLLINP